MGCRICPRTARVGRLATGGPPLGRRPGPLFHVISGLCPPPRLSTSTRNMSSDLREISRDEVAKASVYSTVNETVLTRPFPFTASRARRLGIVRYSR
jgi:hypothetical protein